MSIVKRGIIEETAGRMNTELEIVAVSMLVEGDSEKKFFEYVPYNVPLVYRTMLYPGVEDGVPTHVQLPEGGEYKVSRVTPAMDAYYPRIVEHEQDHAIVDCEGHFMAIPSYLHNGLRRRLRDRYLQVLLFRFHLNAEYGSTAPSETLKKHLVEMAKLHRVW